MRRRPAPPPQQTSQMSEPDYTSIDVDPEANIPSSFYNTRKPVQTFFNPRSYNFRRRVSVAGVVGMFIVAGLLASMELGRRRGHFSGECFRNCRRMYKVAEGYLEIFLRLIFICYFRSFVGTLVFEMKPNSVCLIVGSGRREMV